MLPTLSRQIWRPGPATPDRLAEFIHVWRFSLNPTPSLFAKLGEVLSSDERARAQRFRFDVHRNQFIAAHGCLRDILSRYLNLSPDVLEFSFSEYGKPYLKQKSDRGQLEFNLSHSHELGLAAVTSHSAVGVDIEYVRPELADEQVAWRFFSSSEVDRLMSLPEEKRKDGFFTCWTRKEAYIKARGEGLSMPLDQFDVSFEPGELARLIQTRPDPAQALQWKLYELSPGSGYVAALAVAGTRGEVTCWDWMGVSPG